MNTVAKTYCYTLNNYTQEEYKALVELEGVTYHVIGKEVGVEGTPHIQGCVTFRSAQRFNHVKDLLPRAHIEKAENTARARKYCKKDGDFIEIDNRSQGKRTDLDDAIETLKQGGVKAVQRDHPTVFVKYPGGIKQLGASYKTPRSPAQPPRVAWYYGPTGIGKTRWVHDHWASEDIYVCNSNMAWFDGYHQQEVMLLDDFRGSSYKFHDLLRLLDRYPMQVEVKGAHVQINSPRIIITSAFAPDKIYNKEAEDQAQLLRRCTDIIEFVFRDTEEDEPSGPGIIAHKGSLEFFEPGGFDLEAQAGDDTGMEISSQPDDL